VKVTDKFVYLGSTVDSTIATTPVGLPIFFDDSDLHRDGPVRPSLASCVQTVVLYGAEAWTLLKEDSRRLQEVHVDMPKAYMYPRY